MDDFNERVRRVANLTTYGVSLDDIISKVGCSETELRMLMACADIFQMPVTPRVEPAAVSGEFIAR